MIANVPWEICSFIFIAFTIPLVFILQVLRRKFPKKVNCWFCNKDTKVPYNEQNSFVCPSCNQYNGFNNDGGYNKCIPEQHDEMLNRQPPSTKQNTLSPTNGLCKICNNNQQLKVYQLANFVPMNDDNYDVEIEHFQRQLEKAYKLCPKCDTFTRNVISKQSRWMLGLKLSQLQKAGRSLLNLNETTSAKIAEIKRFNGLRTAINITAILILIVTFTYVYKGANDLNQLHVPYIDVIRKYFMTSRKYIGNYIEMRDVDEFMKNLNLTFKEALILAVVQGFCILTIMIFGPLYKNKQLVVKDSSLKQPAMRTFMPTHYRCGSIASEFENSIDDYMSPLNSTDISTDTIESDYETFNKSIKNRRNHTFVQPIKSVPIFGDRALFENSLNKSKSPVSFEELNRSFHSVKSNQSFVSTKSYNTTMFHLNNDLNLSLSSLSIGQRKTILSPPKLKNPWGGNYWDAKIEPFSRSSSQSSGFISNQNSCTNSISGEIDHCSIFSEPIYNSKGFVPINNEFNHYSSFSAQPSDNRSLYSVRTNKSVHSNRTEPSLFNSNVTRSVHSARTEPLSLFNLNTRNLRSSSSKIPKFKY